MSNDSVQPLIGDRVALAMMARAPSDEQGKTRLSSVLGSNAGADLRRAIFLDTLHVVRQIGTAELVVLFTPATAEVEFMELTNGAVDLLSQRGENLGDRLQNAFTDLFARQYSSVLIIGSDLPTLPPPYIERALSDLAGQVDPITLGPALDGGYYLVGLRRPHPELFEGIPWSTAGVLTATVDIAKALGLTVSILPEWYDVDSVDDLRRAVESSRSEAHRARHTKDLLARLAAARRQSTAER